MRTSDPAEAPSSRKGLRIHPLVGLLIVGSLALAMWRANLESDGNAYRMGHATGQWLGSMMISSLLAIIAYFVAKRSTAVFNISFALVASMLVVANILMIARGGMGRGGSSQREVMRQFEQEMAGVKAEIRDKVMAEDTEGTKAATDKAVAALDKAGAALKGDVALITKAGADAARYLQSVVEPFDKASTEFQELGGIAAEGLTPTIINQRLDALGKTRRAHDTLRVEIAKMKEWFEKRCLEYGVSAQGAREASAGFASAGKLTSLIRMHEQTEVLLTLFRELLVHLRDTQERWTVTAGGDTITFEDDEDAAKYNDIMDRVQIAAEKESQFQREALER